MHCAIWINVEYSHGIEAEIKRIHFGVSTGILAYNKVFRFIWLVGVVLGTIFLLMIKWGMSL